MRTIEISNFRCYDHIELAFRPGINLFIGDNSSGKTSLIRACNFVTNSFFCGYSDENTVWKSVDNSDFRFRMGKEGIVLPWLPVNISFTLSDFDVFPVSLPDGRTFATDGILSHPLWLQKNSPKNTRNLLTGVSGLKEYGANLYAASHVEQNGTVRQLNALPVYACFTTEDIHSSRKITREKFKEYVQMPSFGYYECYDCRGLMDYWLDRLLVLQEANMGTIELDNVRGAIRSALGVQGCNIIDDIIVRPVRRKVYFRYVDERVVEAGMLSDGYKRLVNIVLDIAMRCALLNKELYGDQAYRQTHGTVIIDEIDAHLHPALQVRVMKALHDTFPHLQFIVSTHAPLVMSSVESNEQNVVYKLEYKNGIYSHHELNTYGLDATTIMEVAMGQAARDLDVDYRLKKVFDLIDSDRLVEARQLLGNLQEMLNNGNPELAKADAILSFMED